MKAMKRAKPEQEWNLDHIHGVYVLIKSSPQDANYESVDFWRKAMNSNDCPIQLRDFDEDSLLSLWVHIQRITKKNLNLFTSLFKDFESSLVEKGKEIHEKIRSTLSHYFFPTRKVYEKAGGAEVGKKDDGKTGGTGKTYGKTGVGKPGTATATTGPGYAGAKSEPTIGTSQPHAKKTALDEAILVPINNSSYEFRVHTSARFPKVNLSLLNGCSSGKNLTNSFDAMDKEVFSGGLLAGKADDSKGKFLVALNSLYNKTISKDMLEKKLKSEPKPKAVPSPEEKKKLQETALSSMKKELLELQQKYNKSIEEVSDLYTRVSGDMAILKSYMEGGKAVLWTESDDSIIKGPQTSEGYMKLKAERGESEIAKRKAFLGI